MAGNSPLLDLRLKRSKHSCIKGLISVCRHPCLIVGPGHMLSTYKYLNTVYFHVVVGLEGTNQVTHEMISHPVLANFASEALP